MKTSKQLFSIREIGWFSTEAEAGDQIEKLFFNWKAFELTHECGIALSPKDKSREWRNKLKTQQVPAWSAVKCHSIYSLSSSFHRCLHKYWEMFEILNFNLLWNQWTTHLDYRAFFQPHEWYRSVAINNSSSRPRSK